MKCDGCALVLTQQSPDLHVERLSDWPRGSLASPAASMEPSRQKLTHIAESPVATRLAWRQEEPSRCSHSRTVSSSLADASKCGAAAATATP